MVRPTAKRVTWFYNQRGKAEQYIKEGKNAIRWTQLSYRKFRNNAVRFQLHALAEATPRSLPQRDHLFAIALITFGRRSQRAIMMKRSTNQWRRLRRQPCSRRRTRGSSELDQEPELDHRDRIMNE